MKEHLLGLLVNMLKAEMLLYFRDQEVRLRQRCSRIETSNMKFALRHVAMTAGMMPKAAR